MYYDGLGKDLMTMDDGGGDSSPVVQPLFQQVATSGQNAAIQSLQQPSGQLYLPPGFGAKLDAAYAAKHGTTATASSDSSFLDTLAKAFSSDTSDLAHAGTQALQQKIVGGTKTAQGKMQTPTPGGGGWSTGEKMGAAVLALAVGGILLYALTKK